VKFKSNPEKRLKKGSIEYLEAELNRLKEESPKVNAAYGFNKLYRQMEARIKKIEKQLKHKSLQDKGLQSLDNP